MSFKLDYGLRLKEEGMSKDVDLDFYDFHLYSLTLPDDDQFSTMVEIPLMYRFLARMYKEKTGWSFWMKFIVFQSYFNRCGALLIEVAGKENEQDVF